MRVCIIGAGTYGCYISKCVSDHFKNAEIHLFEVGDAIIKNEQEIGYESLIKGNKYEGLSKGRFFGLGGTSNKWGGQILTFSEVDFKTQNTFLKEIIELNTKYKSRIHSRLQIPLPNEDEYLDKDLAIKNGIWLSVLRRNLFRLLQVNKISNLKLRTNTRIIKLERCIETDKIDTIHFWENDQIKTEKFDFVFLSSGAFESARILLSSGLIEDNLVYFSDHISKEYCTVKGSTQIGNNDFIFRLNGLSLITKRIIGEQDDFSFYLHPVYNLDFKFFSIIKKLMFNREVSMRNILSLFRYAFLELPLVLQFIWKVVVERKMFVKNNSWSFYLDIENPFLKNSIQLAQKKDRLGIATLEVDYQINEDASLLLSKIEKRIDEYLLANNVHFEKKSNTLNAESYEDIYHPYGMFDFKSMTDYETRWNGLLVVSTGVVPRAGGINPTAALFPVLENFIENKLDL